jgi:pyridoxamine 5'-phosphate oxidase
MAFDDLREDYSGTPLLESDVSADPFEQFSRWLEEAVDAQIPLANAMALATVARNGQPSLRMVLLKEFGERGLMFVTNYESRKGEELRRNPRASLLFYWEPLHRQIRIQGRVSRASAEESDAYFGSRPRGSNVAAIASAQSRQVASRAALDGAIASKAEELEGQLLQRPDSWGGYWLMPHRFEFWQGRESRVHDRLVYQQDREGAWDLVRLYP